MTGSVPERARHLAHVQVVTPFPYQAVELSAGAFFTLRDGLVREWSDYLDMSEVARALGH